MCTFETTSRTTNLELRKEQERAVKLTSVLLDQIRLGEFIFLRGLHDILVHGRLLKQIQVERKELIVALLLREAETALWLHLVTLPNVLALRVAGLEQAVNVLQKNEGRWQEGVCFVLLVEFCVERTIKGE